MPPQIEPDIPQITEEAPKFACSYSIDEVTKERHYTIKQVFPNESPPMRHPEASLNGHESKSSGKKKPTSPTMADKLKQSLAQPQQFSHSAAASPSRMQVQAQPQPRLVVKEVTVAKLPKDKTRSLMVSGLYRGLKLDDVVKYFGQFGTVLNCTSPPVVKTMNDGAKYVFVKFADYEAVEKAVGKF